jgi:hypothetical protein
MKRFSQAATAVGVALALLATSCSSASTMSNSSRTIVPVRTANPDSASSRPVTATSLQPATPTKASRQNPLAERKFRVQTRATTSAQRHAIRALEGYFDALVIAFATNKLPETMRRYTVPELYQDAQHLVAHQVDKGYVLYGRYTFSILIKGVRPPVAVMDVCVNQRNTRLHDAKTDKPGRLNNTPYVRVQYTLNVLAGAGWVVTGYKGSNVAACPS